MVLDLQGGYILDSGLDAGLELPFTCKGGICGCCVGRVAEGQVDQSDVSVCHPSLMDSLQRTCIRVLPACLPACLLAGWLACCHSHLSHLSWQGQSASLPISLHNSPIMHPSTPQHDRAVLLPVFVADCRSVVCADR